ncbi:MAG: hypothetical protein A2Y00_07145 [Omnitrophica WOR_2 bacterium GWF2_43_52]|nr:MAG: hypothetical protein A2Y01_07805 [Omnitrophica WOR_2 bacterium GWC2_44_8]OGX20263.1 MAG: hypothetical protein A2Y00_07145 [Omnitrophica WOR_2 bacterium GWF2_43_52]OGX58033.1 MAG: hypothetical protein A2460_02050 [Omnitrophica WOR_2 bacterium RIFOXYC2_FULL_43_9]
MLDAQGYSHGNPEEGGISIVFPVYNEEDTIEQVVQSTLNFIPKLFRHYEIIIVDDGSNDRSGDIIRQLSFDTEAIRGVYLPKNRGYGIALASGFKVVRYPLVFFMDADGQFCISDIEKLLCYIEHYDIVIGSRCVRNDDLYRIFIGKVYNWLTCFLFGMKIKDITCGFKLFKTPILTMIGLKSRGGFINAEILIKAKMRGCSLKEVTVQHLQRTQGTPSGAHPVVFIKKIIELLSMFFKIHCQKFLL